MGCIYGTIRRSFKNGKDLLYALNDSRLKAYSTKFSIKCEGNSKYIIVGIYHKYLQEVQHKTNKGGKCRSHEISMPSNVSKCYFSFTRNSPSKPQF